MGYTSNLLIGYPLNVVKNGQYKLALRSLNTRICNALEFLNGKLMDVYGVSLIKYKHSYGKKFVFNRLWYTTNSVKDDYELFDLRPTDVVLDIGTGIGAFSLMVCDRVKHVYALEPLFDDELSENIRINNVDNITVINKCLGNGKNVVLSFRGKKKCVEPLTLSRIIECIGNVDFIKCDCEGCEWNIKPEELSGVRRIEMEYHVMKNSGKTLSDFLDTLQAAGFEYRVHTFGVAPVSNMTETGLIHAWRTL